MQRVVIPQIFENMEEATIGKWLKAEGESVKTGDGLCELITEKTTLDLQAEADGTLLRQVVPEKSVIPAGYIVALIGSADEALPDVDSENAALLAKKAELPQAETHPGADATSAPVPSLNVPAISVPSIGAAPAGEAAGSRIRATPAARRAAKVANVTLEDVAAAFPDKVLSEEDVKAFASR